MRKLTTFWMLIMLCMPLAMMGGNTKTSDRLGGCDR